MKQVRPILIFIGKFLLAFILLSMLYQYALNKPYTQLLGKSVEALYDGSFGKNGTKDVQLPGAENKKNDKIRIFIMDEDMKNKYRQQVAQHGQKNVLPFKPPLIEMDTWIHAGLYFVFFIALVIASTFNWKRALIAILVGMLILHLFFVWKTGVRLNYEAYSNKIGGMSFGGLREMINSFLHNLFRLVGANLMIAILVWLLIAFGKDDYQKWMERLQPTK